jgi:hypothetical protein
MNDKEILQATFLQAFSEFSEEAIIDSLLDSDEGVLIPSGEFSHKETALLEDVRAAYQIVRKTLGQDDAIDLLFQALCAKSRTGTLAINLEEPTDYRTVWYKRNVSSAGSGQGVV